MCTTCNWTSISLLHSTQDSQHILGVEEDEAHKRLIREVVFLFPPLFLIQNEERGGSNKVASGLIQLAIASSTKVSHATSLVSSLMFREG